MTVAAISKTFPRVSWLVGARSDSATFNSSVGNDNFIAEEITRALIETESEIAQDLADSRHPKRVDFLAWSSPLSNEADLPAHLGEVEAVQVSLDGTYALAEETTRENIRLWRENYNDLFDTIDDRFFNITGNTITFVGTAAKVKIFTFTPNQSAHQIDNIFEPVIIAGTVPKLLKIGVPTALANHYGNQYDKMRQLIRQGHLLMPGIQELQKVE